MTISDAARPFVDAFDYDPGHSDLDNEQPITITVTLGDWRRLNAVLSDEERKRAYGMRPEAEEIARLRLALAKAADTLSDAEKVFSMYGRDSAAAAMTIAVDHCRDVLCGREQSVPQKDDA